MNDAAWERLRAALLQHFDEDTVQQAILRLLQKESKGPIVLDPLRWCRRAASRIRRDGYRRRSREQAAKDTLAVLKIPLDNRSGSEVKRDQKRKERRRKTA